MHHYQPTDHFAKKLLHLKKSDPLGYGRIRKTINRLLVEPNGADGRMVGLYHGRLKKYLTTPKAQLDVFQGMERAFFRVSVARTATVKPPWMG